MAKVFDIQTGMLTVSRSGMVRMCIAGTLVSSEGGGGTPLYCFTDDLTHQKAPGRDIMEVYELDPEYPYGADMVYWTGNNFSALMMHAKLVWERQDPVVEMTVAEIEKKLGVTNLKIVK